MCAVTGLPFTPFYGQKVSARFLEFGILTYLGNTILIASHSRNN